MRIPDMILNSEELMKVIFMTKDQSTVGARGTDLPNVPTNCFGPCDDWSRVMSFSARIEPLKINGQHYKSHSFS